MKKKDLILIASVLIAAIVVWLIISFASKTDTGKVYIKVDGNTQGVYDLNKNQEIVIKDGTNILQIKDGEAFMIDADCPDKLCMKHKPIKQNHESIICLPNKVVVEVLSDAEQEYDSNTN